MFIKRAPGNAVVIQHYPKKSITIIIIINIINHIVKKKEACGLKHNSTCEHRKGSSTAQYNWCKRKRELWSNLSVSDTLFFFIEYRMLSSSCQDTDIFPGKHLDYSSFSEIIFMTDNIADPDLAIEL